MSIFEIRLCWILDVIRVYLLFLLQLGMIYGIFRYQPKMVYGVDIGQAIVNKAKANVETFVNRNQHFKYPKEVIDDVSKLPLYLR